MTSHWVPLEVSSLRSRAQEHISAARQHTKQDDDGSNATAAGTRPALNVQLGNDLWRGQQKFTIKEFKTGSSGIDEVLSSCKNFRVWSIAAEDGMLGSTFAYHLAVGFLMEQPAAVSVVDTTGSFDVVKVLNIIQDRLRQEPKHGRPADSMAILDCIQVSRIFDVEGLDQIITELESAARSPSSRMLIVDNIASIFAPEIAKEKIHGCARLDTLCLRLREMAFDRGTTILLLNTVAKANMNIDGARGHIPLSSLGRSFADLMDVSALLRTSRAVDGSSSVLNSILLKNHSTMKGDPEARFRLIDGYKLESVP